MNKVEMRRLMQQKLKEVPSDVMGRWSSEIAVHLYNLHDWVEADTIGITISRSREVDTRAIIEKGWGLGKRIVVPKCEPETRGMTFRVLQSFEQLEVVYYGLEEPKEAETKAISLNEIDLLIVPGLVYNKTGYRVGFGGGYYDRFLSNYNGRTAALAFEVQLVEELPIEPHDMPVDSIITNEQVVLCRS
ncbi:MAG TPA: 5-formyltetrahydrofolate cyclo-ligase [Bacillus bacterium]|nr:5-formyltetrahydrofolate cyclo-ligase [Bacillus sp. (in: firmicutes)]